MIKEINFWLLFGFFAQSLFFFRFLIQWVASEREGRSVIPIYFWYFSLAGGVGLFVYAIHIKDPVFVIGQGLGVFVYVRNLMLINQKNGKHQG